MKFIARITILALAAVFTMVGVRGDIVASETTIPAPEGLSTSDPIESGVLRTDAQFELKMRFNGGGEIELYHTGGYVFDKEVILYRQNGTHEFDPTSDVEIILTINNDTTTTTIPWLDQNKTLYTIDYAIEESEQHVYVTYVLFRHEHEKGNGEKYRYWVKSNEVAFGELDGIRTDIAPIVEGYRETVNNYLVKDTITWTVPDNLEGIVGYDIRWMCCWDWTWYNTGGYVDDSNVVTWNNVDNGEGAWSNDDRWFQVRYDYGDGVYGPWSDSFTLYQCWDSVGSICENERLPPLSDLTSLDIVSSPGDIVSHIEGVTLTADLSVPLYAHLYSWEHIGGSRDLRYPDGQQQQFINGGESIIIGADGHWPHSPGVYTFNVRVVLQDGTHMTDQKVISFIDPSNYPPAPEDITVNISVYPGSNPSHDGGVILMAEVSDPAQVASYRWTHVGGSQDLSKHQRVSQGGVKITIGGRDWWPYTAGSRTFQLIVTLTDGSEIVAEETINFHNSSNQSYGPANPDTSQVPTVTATRELFTNGEVKDTINWTPPDNPIGLLGHDIRWTIDDGETWGTQNGYVTSALQLTWNSQDDGLQEWDNTRRGFQVRYDFGGYIGYGPWSETVYLDPKSLSSDPNDPATSQVPTVTATREVLANGKVKDTINWTAPDNTTGLVGYDTRRTTDDGSTWWTSDGYVDDPAVLTWNSQDNAGQEWDNIRRGFQVRYDFGSDGYGPWSDIFYRNYREPSYNPGDPVTSQIPTVTGTRIILSNGKVKDTINWTAPANTTGLVGYDTRRTTDSGYTWWTSGGYVSDPNVTTWNSKDNAGQEWDNRIRGFQVRYDFGSDGYGPWSYTFYLD